MSMPVRSASRRKRILVHQRVYGDFLDALRGPVEAIRTGDPFAEETTLSALISEADAVRVGACIEEAGEGGARVEPGGKRGGGVFAPTIVADVNQEMRIFQDGLFGPA